MDGSIIADHNSNIDTSLSKSLSAPRRCSYCQKLMFFKTYRCKHCRYRCHKRCAAHKKSSSSCHKSYSGEEHWTKVLQANEVNSNIEVTRCRRYHHSHCHYSPRHSASSSGKSSRRSSFSRHAKDQTDDATAKDTNIFTNLYSRFCQWVNSTRKDGSPGSRPLSRSSSLQSDGGQDLLHLLSHLPEDLQQHRACMHASISSEESFGAESNLHPSYSSTCSSLTIISTSTNHSELPLTDALPSNSGGNYPSDYISTWRSCSAGTDPVAKYQYFNASDNRRNGHTNLTFTISCPLRTKIPSLSVPESERTSLCATWPPISGHHYNIDPHYDVRLDQHECEESVFHDADSHNNNRDPTTRLKDSLGELSIAHSDLQVGECLRVGRRRRIHKGKWHGDVMIHMYEDIPESEMEPFWEEISKLSMIRHENIALFMGACIEAPNLSVITSVRKGHSLYEQIHTRREKMSLHSRVNIVRQIAQGMGYLHARGIVMCKLNSRNIHLEPKVKLSLLDYGMPEEQYDRPGYGSVPRGHLAYTAPEMLKTLRVESPRLTTDTPHTTQTDVYAFGTVLYELMAGHFPLRGLLPEVMIYHVVKGRRQSLRELNCNANLKGLMTQCWLAESDDRPSFSAINKELQQNGALHKRHSSSEPERLHKSGLGKVGSIFT